MRKSTIQPAYWLVILLFHSLWVLVFLPAVSVGVTHGCQIDPLVFYPNFIRNNPKMQDLKNKNPNKKRKHFKIIFVLFKP